MRITRISTPMNEKDKSGPFQGYTKEKRCMLFTKVLTDDRNEQTASASCDNETRRLNEPVIFRFRDFKFAQRRGASRHLRCGTSSRTITCILYTRSTFPKLRRLRPDEVVGGRRHWHAKEMSHLTQEI